MIKFETEINAKSNMQKAHAKSGKKGRPPPPWESMGDPWEQVGGMTGPGGGGGGKPPGWQELAEFGRVRKSWHWHSARRQGAADLSATPAFHRPLLDACWAPKGPPGGP